MKTRYEEMRLEAAEMKENFLMRIEDIRLGAIEFKENVEFLIEFMRPSPDVKIFSKCKTLIITMI